MLPAWLEDACSFLSEEISRVYLVKPSALIALVARSYRLACIATYRPGVRMQLKQSPCPSFEGVPKIQLDIMSESGVTEEVSKKLSRRELLILRALTEGASDRAIAEKLVLRESTAKKLVQNLLRKLDVRNRAQATKWARDKLGDV